MTLPCAPTTAAALTCLALALFSACASPLERLTTKIEQTQTHDLGWTPPETNDLQDIARRLKWAARYLGISIQPDDQMAAIELGRYQPADRAVYYNAELKFDAQVQVIAHELAHALQPPTVEEAERELFADTVSYLVLQPDRDYLENYARYLGRYKTNARDFLKLYEQQIWWAVRFLRMDGNR